MDLDEDNEQKRKDFNNIIFLNTTLSGAAKFNLCASLTRMQEHMLEDRCCKYCDQTFASRTEKLSHKKYMCKQHEIILGQSVDLHINTYKNLYENATAKVTNRFQSLVVRNPNHLYAQFPRPCNISALNVATKERRRMLL